MSHVRGQTKHRVSVNAIFCGGRLKGPWSMSIKPCFLLKNRARFTKPIHDAFIIISTHHRLSILRNTVIHRLSTLHTTH